MKVIYYFFSRLSLIIFFLTICVLLSWDCSNPKNAGNYYSNIRPKIRLSNIPPLDDTIKSTSPQLTLNWVGDDPDGFVVGFKYTWTYRLNGVDTFHAPKIILNLTVQGNMKNEPFALMLLTQDEKLVPAVFKYFATIDPAKGLDPSVRDSLSRGDTITTAGIKIFASNSDSIKIMTGQRISLSFPVHTNPWNGTFIFDSPDEWNFHTFMVSAIDNIGDISITPAMVSFETPKVLPPHTSMVDWPMDTALVIAGFTPTYNGIQFSFKSVDPQGWSDIQYRWVVDKDQWLARTGNIPWSDWGTSATVGITAADFPDPYATKHIFYVQSKNAYGVIDTVGYTERIIYAAGGNRDSIGVVIDSAWHSFYTTYPAFARHDLPKSNKILFINNTAEPRLTPVSPGHPTADMVFNYYRTIFNSLGIPDSLIVHWRVVGTYFPTRAEIGKYSRVFMFSDCTLFNSLFYPYYVYGTSQQWEFGSDKQNIIKDYCFVGGKVIFSGWAMSSGTNTPANEEFRTRIIHSDYKKLILLQTPDCIGANGRRGYPDLRIDTSKFNTTTDTSWHGGMRYMFANYPVGFGEIIHKYAPSLTSNPNFGDLPISIRYNGITFNVIYFGIPLYYMQRPAVDSSLAMALRDIEK